MIRATSHQGSSNFHGNGRQCMTNSLAAILESYNKPVREWSTDTLDQILERGDQLYSLHSIDNYLMLEDLKPECDGFYHSLHISNVLTGTTMSQQANNLPYYTLEEALGSILSEESRCLFTMGQSNPSYSTSIIHDTSQYFMFDPHSRNEAGMPEADGCAVLSIHKNLATLCLFIRHLSALLDKKKNIPFEVASVSTIIDSTDIIDSEFEGFSDISDGELTCRLYMLEENCSDTSSVSSVSSASLMTSGSDSCSIPDITESIENLNDSALLMSSIDIEIFDSFDIADDLNCVILKPVLNNQTQSMIFVNDPNSVSPQIGGSLPTGSEVGANPAGMSHQMGWSLPTESSQARANPTGVSHQIGGSLSTGSAEVGANPTGVSHQKGGSLPTESAQPRANPTGVSHQMDGSLPTESAQSRANPTGVSHQMDGSLPTESSQARANPTGVAHQIGGSLPTRSAEVGYNPTGMSQQMGGSLPTESAHVRANPTGVSQDMGMSIPTESDQEIDNQTGVSNQLNVNVSCAEDSLTRKRSRKRQRKEENWKRNRVKFRRNSGKSYVTSSGKIKRAKLIKPGCGQKCKKKCHSKVNYDQRETIFHEFWGSGNYAKHKEFICNTVKMSKVKRITVRDNVQRDRKVSRHYKFIIDGEVVDVCQKFYLDTLDISPAVIASATCKPAYFTHTSSHDRRGKHTNRANKIPDVVIQDVKEHIDSFPRVESHYCRKSCSKEYLEGGLNLSKMYHLYAEQCESNNVCPVKESMYRHIFNTESNIAFNKPLKDMCDFCFQYSNLCPQEQTKLKGKFDRHIKNKILARNAKDTAKAAAQSDQSFCAACFDLQQVMMLPKANQSCLYYSRKLNNYNLSLYSLGTNDAYCYVWNETLGGRGSCEIATCVFSFLKTMAAKNIKSVDIFSDNCTGQNRNRFFLTMLWYSLKALNFDNLCHKFLERGHTQNENDSVHSTIERACKNVQLYTTSQWATCMRMARRSKPYFVTDMISGNFHDFKDLSTKVRNLDRDSQGCKIKWMEIKTVSFNNQCPDTAVIQYDYDGPLVYLNVQPRLRNNEKSLPNLKSLFRHGNSPQISKSKYEDLRKLCNNNTIPEAYRSFYESLPADS